MNTDNNVVETIYMDLKKYYDDIKLKFSYVKDKSFIPTMIKVYLKDYIIKYVEKKKNVDLTNANEYSLIKKEELKIFNEFLLHLINIGEYEHFHQLKKIYIIDNQPHKRAEQEVKIMDSTIKKLLAYDEFSVERINDFFRFNFEMQEYKFKLEYKKNLFYSIISFLDKNSSNKDILKVNSLDFIKKYNNYPMDHNSLQIDDSVFFKYYQQLKNRSITENISFINTNIPVLMVLLNILNGIDNRNNHMDNVKKAIFDNFLRPSVWSRVITNKILNSEGNKNFIKKHLFNEHVFKLCHSEKDLKELFTILELDELNDNLKDYLLKQKDISFMCSSFFNNLYKYVLSNDDPLSKRMVNEIDWFSKIEINVPYLSFEALDNFNKIFDKIKYKKINIGKVKVIQNFLSKRITTLSKTDHLKNDFLIKEYKKELDVCQLAFNNLDNLMKLKKINSIKLKM